MAVVLATVMCPFALLLNALEKMHPAQRQSLAPPTVPTVLLTGSQEKGNQPVLHAIACIERSQRTCLVLGRSLFGPVTVVLCGSMRHLSVNVNKLNVRRKFV